jgi:CubicO group peptidase (beta-lactamase class C family)
MRRELNSTSMSLHRRRVLAGGAALAGAGLVPLGACSPDRSAAQATRDVAQALAPPPTRGLDAARMDQVVEVASGLRRLRSLIVVRHGERQAEHSFNGGPPLTRAVNIKSASKSIISALVGIAIEEGVLEGVDQPVLSVLRSDAPANPDPRLEQLTVGHLLSMRAGLERTSGNNYGAWVTSSNWVRYALSRPFVDDPGGQRLYSTGSTHLLSAMLTRASGRSTLALAREWLAEPLGIAIAAWDRDPQGIYLGGNNMALSPRDMAAFGELYRNGGRARGAQIVPAAWVEESWAPRTVSRFSRNEYGYCWFIGEAGGHPVRFAWGYGGQMIYVINDLDLTAVMTSDPDVGREGDHIRALNGLLGDGIVPAAIAGA